MSTTLEQVKIETEHSGYAAVFFVGCFSDDGIGIEAIENIVRNELSHELRSESYRILIDTFTQSGNSNKRFIQLDVTNEHDIKWDTLTFVNIQKDHAIRRHSAYHIFENKIDLTNTPVTKAEKGLMAKGIGI